MSEASTDRVADRPAEVTDPLLWDLAAAVADAHQPDAERVCASPSCAGAAWPCAAWNAAQTALITARSPRPGTPSRPATAPGPIASRPAGTVAPAARPHATGQPAAADATERLAATAA
ncbi:hypothetical protein ACGF5H_10830 [Micromonospora chalcea]